MRLLQPIPEHTPFGAVAPRRTTVRVTLSPAPAPEEERSRVCVLGLMPPGSPSLDSLAPRLGTALRRSSRLGADAAGGGVAIAQLRLRSADRGGLLPGLEAAHPSLLRDSVEVALTAGAPQVEALLVWPEPGETAWGPQTLAALAPLLEQLPGALLLLPDLLGDPATGAPSTDALVAVLRTLGPIWTQLYQVALLDLPAAAGAGWVREELLSRVLGHDLALCAWEGTPRAVQAQGWRSAAAVVAGAMTAREDGRGRSARGLPLPLPPPRYVPEDHRGTLGFGGTPTLQAPADLPLVRVRLAPGAAGALQGRILTEPSLRRPLGSWPLPALLEVKDIHRRLVEAASRFVFQSADGEQALALALGLRRAVRAQVEEGLLVGPSGDGPPLVRSRALTDPAEPGLLATVSALLRPWALSVQLRLSVRPTGRPELEVL